MMLIVTDGKTLIVKVMSPEKFEKLMWDGIAILFSIVGISVGGYFSYLVIYYSMFN